MGMIRLAVEYVPVQGYTSQFGPIVGGEEAENFGSHVRAYLPHAYLAEKRRAVDGLSIAITNAVAHCTNAVTVFLRGMRGSAGEGEATDEKPVPECSSMGG
jgi:hypothetical protein